MDIYVTRFAYGKPHITRLMGVRETHKMFIMDDPSHYEIVLGHKFFYATRFHKAQEIFFRSRLEAIEYLLNVIREKKDTRRNEIAELGEQEDMLSDIVFKLKYKQGG